MNNQQSHDPISHHPTEITHPPQSEMFQDGHDYAYQPSSGNPIQESTVPVWKPFHQSPARGTPSYYGLSPHQGLGKVFHSSCWLGDLSGLGDELEWSQRVSRVVSEGCGDADSSGQAMEADRGVA